MTLKELSQLHHLNHEIIMDKERLRELEEKAVPGVQRIAPTFRGKGLSDTVGDCAAEIADLKNTINAKLNKCLYERSRLEKYISGIEDSLTRQVFTLRFVNGLRWEQIAANVGGGNSGDSCRMLVSRYIKQK